MTRQVAKVSMICLAVMAFWLAAPSPVRADPISISSCNSTITICDVYEDSPLNIGNNCCFIAGDWILLESDGTTSDVLRFFNNVVNTGGGTGLGSQAFLYSDDQANLPTTFSVNARRVMEGPPDAGGETLTTFTSNGTLYRVHSEEVSPVPEPSTLGLLAVGLAAARRLRRQDQPADQPYES